MAEFEDRFASRLKAARVALDWSAQRLADACATEGSETLRRVAISKIECRARGISLDEAVVLSRVFGVSLEAMVSPEPVKLELRVEVTV